MRVQISASPEVERVLAGLGRTEDVTFSPSGRRLAVAGYGHNSVLLLDIAVATAPAAASRSDMSVALTGCVEVSCPRLSRPHGVAFLDEHTLVVANREGGIVMLDAPPAAAGARELTVDAREAMLGNRWVHSPGSVAVSRLDSDRAALLVCNNYANHVSRHVLDRDLAVASNEILLSKGLDVPDGVALSRDGRWIAISSHNTHCVLLYDSSRPLDWKSEPSGMLDKVNSPHGVRFLPDGEHVIVADAGAPFLNVYARKGASWAGTREPTATYRVMDDATFLRGRHNPEEGGAKGIDIDREGRILVTTCESEALAFFDVEDVLRARDRVAPSGPSSSKDVGAATAPLRTAPCPCGSGKRFKHCCGATEARSTPEPSGASTAVALAEAPAFGALMTQALAAQRARAFDAADRLYRHALRLRPENPDALHMLGMVCYERGRFAESARLIRAAGERSQWRLPGILHNYGLTIGTRMLGRNTGALAKVRVDYDRWRSGRHRDLSREEPPLVSVVLVADDSAACIESLGSILAQSYGNLGLVIVDAGMSDEREAAVRRNIGMRRIPLCWVDVRGASPSAALNEGIRRANGRYVNALFAGDRFEPRRIADMVRHVAYQGFEWGFAACIPIRSDGPRVATEPHEESRWIAEIADHVRSSDTVGAALFARLDPTVSPGNLFFSKALSERLGGFRPYASALGWDFALRALRGAEPCFVESPLYRHRLGRWSVNGRAAARAEIDAIFSDYCASAMAERPANSFAPGAPPQGLACVAKGLSVAQGATLSAEVLTRLDDDLLRDDAGRRQRADAGGGERTHHGLDVVGFFMGDFGLGESVRTFAATCRKGGIRARFRDADGVLGARRSNRAMDALLTDELPHGTTLYYMNPDQLLPLRRWQHDRGESTKGRTIGYWYWEIDAFPQRWRPALDAVDEIWVASEYVADIIRRATDKPVIRIPHAFDVVPSRRYTRAEFALPEEKFLFLFTFDFNSFVERKNPLAVVDAFRRAFPEGDERAALVVKCLQGYRFPQPLDQLQTLAAGDPRIVIVDRLLSRDEATGLQSVCDAYVSLHRAEGLGLCMAECMAQGKPVIATGYSGNLDFMNTGNSCLVGYSLIPVRPGDYVDYEPGWFWADPDIGQAAQHMARLVADPGYRRSIGQRAAADMRTGYSHEKVGEAIAARLAELARAKGSAFAEVLP